MTPPAPSPTDGGVRTDAVAQLRALHSITRASARADNDDALLRYTALAAQQALGAASVSIERFEREDGRLRTLVNVGALGPTERELPNDEFYEIDQFATLAFMEQGGGGGARCVDDEDADPTEVALLRALAKHSSLDVPIFLDGAVWGELYATRSVDMTPFIAADLIFAEAVAAQVAAGIAQGAHSRRLEALAHIDTLTGLANRNAIEQRLDEVVNNYLRESTCVCVVIADGNSLKQVNDELGHEEGDRLLMRVGELLSRAAAELPGSLAGRLGGDEFCLVVGGCDTDTLLPVLQQLCEDARKLPQGAGLSCGVASTTDPIGHIGTPGDLVRLADAAQYRAKRGRAPGPVVAGRRLPAEVAAVLAERFDLGGQGREARTERRQSDVAYAIVADAVRLLDGARGRSTLDRLSLVGAAAAGAADASAWWVSWTPAGENVLHTLRHGSARPPSAVGPRSQEYFATGLELPLRDFPDTVRVLDGGWTEQRVDDAGGDDAEQEALRQGGYTAVVAAGGSRGDERWLLEIFADDQGRPLIGLGPTLRVLLALALAEAD